MHTTKSGGHAEKHHDEVNERHEPIYVIDLEENLEDVVAQGGSEEEPTYRIGDRRKPMFIPTVFLTVC